MPVVNSDALLLFLPAFARVGGLFIVGPFWNHVKVPLVVRNGVVLLLVVAVWPTLASQPLPPIDGVWSLAILVFPEFVVGALIGFMARIVFTAAEYGGQLVGMSIGLTMMNVLDPVSNQQVSIVSRFFGLLTLVLFFVVNAHHALLWVLLRSFTDIPIGSLTTSGIALPVVLETVGQVFVLGVGIAAPILAVMLLMELALGLVVRTVPQMNVFIIAFPLKIGVGLFLIVVTMPIMARLLVAAFGTLTSGVGAVLHGM